MEYELNLIPADIIEEESCRERIRIWSYSLLIILIIFAGSSLAIRHNITTLKKDIDILQSVRTGLLEERSNLRAIKAEREKFIEFNRQFEGLSQQSPLIRIFKAFDKSIDSYTTLTHLSGTFISALSNTVKIQGITSSTMRLGEMLHKLATTSIFKNIHLTYASQGESRKGHPILFEIECEISS